jgi:hypothetical protein
MTVPTSASSEGIGTLHETALHAALKAWYAQPGDELEVEVDGFVIDLRRGPLLIEIQTRNFATLKRKLTRLIERHPVRLIHPIAKEKWIVRLAADGKSVVSRRKSPKRGQVETLFTELVSFPELVAHPNFTLEVALTQEEELQCRAKRGEDRHAAWRRKGWRICDRRLLNVVERVELTSPADYGRFLPDALPQPFTSSHLAAAAHQPLYVAQKMTYCLRKMGVIECVGKRGGAVLYTRAPSQTDDVSNGSGQPSKA